MEEALEILCCYARQDQQFLIELKAHLSPLQKQGLINLWADTDISAGTAWENEIGRHLDQAKIILFLVSSDFMASDYCYSKEMKRAIERFGRSEVCVIPLILRPTHWQSTILGTLQALPQNGIPITLWTDRDAAFLDITKGIEQAVRQIITKHFIKQPSSNLTNSIQYYPNCKASVPMGILDANLAVTGQNRPNLIQEEATNAIHKLVMVIDDSSTTQKIVKAVLEREGFDFKGFNDGVEALAWLASPQGRVPDLIFLDIGLPKMDGYEVARRLKSRPQFSKTVIVMLSRYDGMIDKLKARLVGAKDYITKPFYTQTILSMTQSHIGYGDEEL